MKKLGILLSSILILIILTGCETKTKISNTRWVLLNDESEVVFTDKRINWYKSSDDHSDNVKSGTYKFYIGESASNYIVNQLSEYGVTREKLDAFFSSTEDYLEDDFIVVDINYDKVIYEGEETELVNPHAPWYGFLLQNDTKLEVVNMNTGSKYTLIKQ